jgi:hypothetical protein
MRRILVTAFGTLREEGEPLRRAPVREGGCQNAGGKKSLSDSLRGLVLKAGWREPHGITLSRRPVLMLVFSSCSRRLLGMIAAERLFGLFEVMLKLTGRHRK